MTLCLRVVTKGLFATFINLKGKIMF